MASLQELCVSERDLRAVGIRLHLGDQKGGQISISNGYLRRHIYYEDIYAAARSRLHIVDETHVLENHKSQKLEDILKVNRNRFVSWRDIPEDERLKISPNLDIASWYYKKWSQGGNQLKTEIKSQINSAASLTDKRGRGNPPVMAAHVTKALNLLKLREDQLIGQDKYLLNQYDLLIRRADFEEAVLFDTILGLKDMFDSGIALNTDRYLKILRDNRDKQGDIINLKKTKIWPLIQSLRRKESYLRQNCCSLPWLHYSRNVLKISENIRILITKLEPEGIMKQVQSLKWIEMKTAVFKKEVVKLKTI